MLVEFIQVCFYIKMVIEGITRQTRTAKSTASLDILPPVICGIRHKESGKGSSLLLT